MRGRDLFVAFAVVTAAVSQSPIVGRVPPALGAAMRVAWMGVDSATNDVRCGLSTSIQWSCDGLSLDSHGLVVIVGERGVSVTAIELPPLDPAPTMWGRVVHVTPGGAAPDDLHDLTLIAARPERPRLRQQTRRFMEVTDDSVPSYPAR